MQRRKDLVLTKSFSVGKLKSVITHHLGLSAQNTGNSFALTDMPKPLARKDMRRDTNVIMNAAAILELQRQHNP